jgi:hypothetical protein
VLAFRWLDFVAIAFPFILLGGIARRAEGRIVTLLLGAVLGLMLVFPALSSDVPLRWALVLGPMVGGFALGLALHGHKTFLRLQPVLCFLAALSWVLEQAYDSSVSTGNPEGYRRALVSEAFYSAVNLIELLVVFLVVLGVMRLLKRQNTGLALIIALCSLALDTDISFLSYAVIPVLCSALIGDRAQKAGLAPREILEVLAERLSRHPRVAQRIDRSGLGRRPVIRKIGSVLGPALTIVVFVTNLNSIWASERLAEEMAVVINTPGLYLRYGEDWSFTLAQLALAAVPLGVAISGLVTTPGSKGPPARIT